MTRDQIRETFGAPVPARYVRSVLPIPNVQRHGVFDTFAQRFVEFEEHARETEADAAVRRYNETYNSIGAGNTLPDKEHPWGSNPHFTKEEKDRFQRRRIAVFDAGAAAARAGKPSPAVYEGDELGSAETITWLCGVVSVIPDYPHVYGDLVDPRRPKEP